MNTIFDENDKAILSPIVFKQLPDNDLFKTIINKFVQLSTEKELYEYCEIDTKDMQLVIGEPICSFNCFDLFLAELTPYLEDQLIMFQDWQSQELIALAIDDGKLYTTETTVTVTPIEIINCLPSTETNTTLTSLEK